MTGGVVVVLGSTGRNFGAGMSGGTAYVHDPTGLFPSLVNYEMVDLEALEDVDTAFLAEIVRKHAEETGSAVAKALLAEWDDALAHFHKVMPKDYKRVLDVMREAEELDISESETLARVMAASHG
jgi:glutamate synthase (NADPH/NADH) large chain